MQLDRQDLIDGLRDVVTAARANGITGVSIRIVGGAALRLAHFDRDTTADIDAQIEPMDRLAPIIERIANERGWPSTWLNNDAVMFIPAWGQAVDWEPILDDTNVSIAVAPIDALLAMKLNAARPGRDTDDIAKLLALTGIDSLAGAEAVFEAFYPGDALPERCQVGRTDHLGRAARKARSAHAPRSGVRLDSKARLRRSNRTSRLPNDNHQSTLWLS